MFCYFHTIFTLNLHCIKGNGSQAIIAICKAFSISDMVKTASAMRLWLFFFTIRCFSYHYFDSFNMWLAIWSGRLWRGKGKNKGPQWEFNLIREDISLTRRRWKFWFFDEPFVCLIQPLDQLDLFLLVGGGPQPITQLVGCGHSRR